MPRPQPSRSHSSGEGRLALLFWLVVLVAGGLVAYEAIPVRVRMADLQDFMLESAERARFRNEDQLKRAILARARELDLPLDEKNLSVQLSNAQIKIEAHYTVSLEFPFYTWDWRKEHIVDRPVFYW
jgi:hypothetical protein